MNEFKNHIEEEESYLDDIISQTEEIIENAPDGALRIAQKNPNQYYWVTSSSNSQGEYISKDRREIIPQLAQKDYAIKLRKIALKEKEVLVKCKSVYSKNDIGKFHENLSASRKSLINPYVLSDEEYAIEWMNRKNQEIEAIRVRKAEIQYSRGEYIGGSERYLLGKDGGIITDKGERVRSKSEKILADKLYKMNIPYIYEMPLYIKGFGYLSPDFTVLNKRTRSEFYWEHFGMMDKSEYCNKAIRKIETYQTNRIFQGKQLLLTFETSTQFIDMNDLEDLIVNFLL